MKENGLGLTVVYLDFTEPIHERIRAVSFRFMFIVLCCFFSAQKSFDFVF